MAHLAELVDTLTPIFSARTTDAWLEALARAGVPAGPVASIGEMLEHPQTLARDMVIDVEHVTLGRVRSLGSPVKLSGGGPRGATQDASQRGAPILGEHTREVLGEAGWSAEDVDALVTRGSVLAV
jgi:formyl-CoA transferase